MDETHQRQAHSSTARPSTRLYRAYAINKSSIQQRTQINARLYNIITRHRTHNKCTKHTLTKYRWLTLSEPSQIGRLPPSIPPAISRTRCHSTSSLQISHVTTRVHRHTRLLSDSLRRFSDRHRRRYRLHTVQSYEVSTTLSQTGYIGLHRLAYSSILARINSLSLPTLRPLSHTCDPG